MTVNIAGVNLVCPLCKGEILSNRNFISCISCQQEYIQPEGNYINLFPEPEITDKNGNWQERQQEMVQWYQDLLPDLEATVSVFEHDYFPFESYFASLKGNIVDLGGGAGVVRHFLSEDAKLIVVDPSPDWLGADWAKLSRSFPCLVNPPDFILGIGEHLMFEDSSIDVVLSLWSMNHVDKPSNVFKEVLRVLKPGGKFFVVFEDMEPDWRDIMSKSLYQNIGRISWIKMFLLKLKIHFYIEKWTIQSDHLLITEKELDEWKKFGFRQQSREWIANYLTFEFIKM